MRMPVNSSEVLFLFHSLLLLHLLHLSFSQSVPPTFWLPDRDTGVRLQCSSCPPGTYLRAACSTKLPSQCSPCPPGSFTELWNYIGRCLHCSTCSGPNEETEQPCSATQDTRCRCRSGFYYRQRAGMCRQHSSCPVGHGVLLNGTATEDTLCQLCPPGTFSRSPLAQSACLPHRHCSSTQRQLVKGTSWHDIVCSNPGESQDAADYLRDILPAFVLHQNVTSRRLRLLLHHIPGGGQDGQIGERPVVGSAFKRITEWLVHKATAEDIRALPALLKRVRLQRVADRLQRKLQQVEARLEDHLLGEAKGGVPAGGASLVSS